MTFWAKVVSGNKTRSSRSHVDSRWRGNSTSPLRYTTSATKRATSSMPALKMSCRPCERDADTMSVSNETYNHNMITRSIRRLLMMNFADEDVLLEETSVEQLSTFNQVCRFSRLVLTSPARTIGYYTRKIFTTTATVLLMFIKIILLRPRLPSDA